MGCNVLDGCTEDDEQAEHDHTAQDNRASPVVKEAHLQGSGQTTELAHCGQPAWNKQVGYTQLAGQSSQQWQPLCSASTE